MKGRTRARRSRASFEAHASTGRISRRGLLTALAAGGTALAAGRWYLPRSQRPGPVQRYENLSPRAQALVSAAFEGIDPTLVWDTHAHLVGLGTDGSGASVHPDSQSHLHPWRRLQFEIYLAAAGVTDPARADQQYVERLLALQRAAHPQGRMLLLAFDWHVRPDGSEDPANSSFHMPNERVLALARRHPEIEACVSIHPYRDDAVERLRDAARRGARAVKWLPNAMGIDPLSARCHPAYDAMADLGLVLISHTGMEKAVHAEGAQELGNPLRLRGALERGVTVVAAHCASTGTNQDLDAPKTPEEESFVLFGRMLDEAGGDGRLFGDLSAVPQVNREPRVLQTLLRNRHWHARLVNGSDYPLPAIDLIVSTRQLQRRGLLEEAERAPLEEIFEANALLFDFVLKRRLRLIENGSTFRFPPSVFETARLFA